MPIKPELRKQFYGAEWRKLSKRLIERRAGHTCEWCHARNHEPHPRRGYKVVLTVAHVNHIPGDNRPENLVVLCQSCHLSLDRDQHVVNARATRQAKKDAGRPLLTYLNGAKIEAWSRRKPVQRPRYKASKPVAEAPLFNEEEESGAHHDKHETRLDKKDQARPLLSE